MRFASQLYQHMITLFYFYLLVNYDLFISIAYWWAWIYGSVFYLNWLSHWRISFVPLYAFWLSTSYTSNVIYINVPSIQFGVVRFACHGTKHPQVLDIVISCFHKLISDLQVYELKIDYYQTSRVVPREHHTHVKTFVSKTRVLSRHILYHHMIPSVNRPDFEKPPMSAPTLVCASYTRSSLEIPEKRADGLTFSWQLGYLCTAWSASVPDLTRFTVPPCEWVSTEQNLTQPGLPCVNNQRCNMIFCRFLLIPRSSV